MHIKTDKFLFAYISEMKFDHFITQNIRTLVFIFIGIITTFPPICPSADMSFLKTKRRLSQILNNNKYLIPETKYRQLMKLYSKLPRIQRLDKILETPGYFKQIYFNMIFWLQIRLGVAPFKRFFEETGFSRWSLNSAVIFGAVLSWSFLTICVRVRRSPSNRFRFLPEFCFCEEVFSSFANAVTTFETELLASQTNSAVFVTLASVIRAQTIWSLLKSGIQGIWHLNEFLLIYSDDICKKTILLK